MSLAVAYIYTQLSRSVAFFQTYATYKTGLNYSKLFARYPVKRLVKPFFHIIYFFFLRRSQNDRNEPNWNASLVTLHGLYKANEMAV